MTNVLVEGGGRVLGSFLDDGQVDVVDVLHRASHWKGVTMRGQLYVAVDSG